jgi:hypothetical protein
MGEPKERDMNPNDRVLIDLPYKRFENALLWVLEKDTGAVPIVKEIIRLCKVAMRKERIYKQKTKNLRGTK